MLKADDPVSNIIQWQGIKSRDVVLEAEASASARGGLEAVF